MNKWSKVKRQARDIKYRKNKRLAARKLLACIIKTLNGIQSNESP